MVRNIKNKDQYDKALEYEGLTVVDFYMGWCGPCQKLRPVMEKIELDYKKANKKLQIIKMDIDAIPSVSRALKVEAVPRLYFFVNKKPVGKEIVGFKPEEKIVERIEKELKKV